MNIALDFDDTYTRAPTFWNEFIQNCKAGGHDVRIVTYRMERMTDPALDWLAQSIPVIFTNYHQKRRWCRQQIGWEVDIWIDDSPEFIVDREDI